MKKILTSLATLAIILLCFVLLPTEAKAASESDLTFTLNNDGNSYAVTGCKSNASGELGIPATYNGKPVTSIGESAFKDCWSLTSITIPDSVTNIGECAFYYCISLTSITIPDGVTSIGDAAFYYCKSLTSITIPDGVTNISDLAFNDCRSLTSITIPDGVTSIGEGAFNECRSLTSITIPDGVTSISQHTFRGCMSLTSVTIGNGVTSISSMAFDASSNLWHVLYKGTEEQWNAIEIRGNNEYLTRATRHYECTGNEVDPINKTCRICLAANCTHSYDNACDSECNICGSVRTITHDYQSTWSKDNTSHWRECSICGDKKDLVAHTPGAAATETSAQTCTTCGHVITPALNHTHKYHDAMSNDRDGHWYNCTGCSEKKDYAAHVYTNACDADCNICGYTRSVAHNYNETWSKDATNHWIECSVCKDKKDLATHAPGAEATETTPQICTICGYIIKPALNHTHSFATEWTTDDVGHWHACSGCEEKDSYAAHTWENGSCSVCGAVNTNATQPTTTPTEGQEPTTAPTEQPDTNKTEEKGNNIIWIIVVIVVLASAAVVVFIILKKQGLISK